jgi:hypothetical protein
MSFAVIMHLAEGLCLDALLMMKVENFLFLPCRHTNTISFHGGVAVYFALENINKK